MTVSLQQWRLTVMYGARAFEEDKNRVMTWFLVGNMLALVGTVAAADPAPKGAAANGKETVWQSDYIAARSAARQRGKPLLVVFR